jgi:histone arginine demethylase JMJD6
VGEDEEGSKLRLPFRYYLEYLVYNKDDSPLYLFESSLEDKVETREMIKNYTIPAYFKDDLFKNAGEKQRPPYRWFDFLFTPGLSWVLSDRAPLCT